MTGGGFNLQGGFWGVAVPDCPVTNPLSGLLSTIYLPLLSR
jgi:hypothetical protein